ncbi:MAG: SDR family NAD(P)-dependent oxidoreductase [Motiliproteus sp.]
MQKTILITGSTDGIGFATAKMLVSQGHHVLLHGRNPDKLQRVVTALSGIVGGGPVESYQADLSSMAEVGALAALVAANTSSLDVLINNAGIFHTPRTTTGDGVDVRFAVNTLAPYLLTQRLLPLFGPDGRVINLSSAAQSPVDLQALAGEIQLADDFSAYAQSKLALTIWSHRLALSLAPQGLAIIAVNPGSMLGSKMVKEGFGVEGGNLQIGAKVLVRAALEDEFSTASGQYFDNDSGQFSAAHADLLNAKKSTAVVRAIEDVLAEITART